MASQKVLAGLGLAHLRPPCPLLSRADHNSNQLLWAAAGKENKSWRGGCGLPAALNKVGAREERRPWDWLPQPACQAGSQSALSPRQRRDARRAHSGTRRRGGSGAPPAGSPGAAVPPLVLKGGGPGGAAAKPARTGGRVRARSARARAYTGVLCPDWAGPERLGRKEVKGSPAVWEELGIPGQTAPRRKTPPLRGASAPVHVGWVLQTRTTVISVLEPPPQARG